MSETLQTLVKAARDAVYELRTISTKAEAFTHLDTIDRLCAALSAPAGELASDHTDIADRLDFIRAHRDEGGKFSDANGNELLGIAERLLKRANIWRDCFAEITAKATPFGAHQDDPERIVSYIIPCGPIHRAAGKTNFQFFDGEQAVDRWRERALAAEAKLAAPSSPVPDASKAQTDETKAGECSDCPPLEYPTDETRCAPCPNRAPASPAPTREGACCVDLGKEECGYPDCPGPKRTPLPDIAALRERAEKFLAFAESATPGPWAYSPWHIEEGEPAVRGGPTNHIVATFASDDDAAFTAAAKTEASDLIRDLAAALPSTGTGEETR
jgi:hypothetical protein